MNQYIIFDGLELGDISVLFYVEKTTGSVVAVRKGTVILMMSLTGQIFDGDRPEDRLLGYIRAEKATLRYVPDDPYRLPQLPTTPDHTVKKHWFNDDRVSFFMQLAQHLVKTAEGRQAALF